MCKCHTKPSVSRLLPWSDEVRALWKVFHPERVARWESIYKARLSGKTMSEIGDEHGLIKEEVGKIIQTVRRSLYCWEREYGYRQRAGATGENQTA